RGRLLVGILGDSLSRCASTGGMSFVDGPKPSGMSYSCVENTMPSSPLLPESTPFTDFSSPPRLAGAGRETILPSAGSRLLNVSEKGLVGGRQPGAQECQARVALQGFFRRCHLPGDVELEQH